MSEILITFNNDQLRPIGKLKLNEDAGKIFEELQTNADKYTFEVAYTHDERTGNNVISEVSLVNKPKGKAK